MQFGAVLKPSEKSQPDGLEPATVLINLRNTQNTYGLISKLLHWGTVLMIMLAIPLGISLDRMQGQESSIVTTMHQSWGLLVLCLVIARLTWRLLNTQPVMLGKNPEWMNKAARIVHWLAYALILLQVTAGLLMSQADGTKIVFARKLTIPAIVPESESLHSIWHQVHETTWILMIVLITGHAAAALHHHFVVKDATLKRMWFGTLVKTRQSK